MSKRQRFHATRGSHAARARHDRIREEGIAAFSDEPERQGLSLLTSPIGRLVFFAGLNGIILLLVAGAVMS